MSTRQILISEALIPELSKALSLTSKFDVDFGNMRMTTHGLDLDLEFRFSSHFCQLRLIRD